VLCRLVDCWRAVMSSPTENRTIMRRLGGWGGGRVEGTGGNADARLGG
jgi:hypothetical protein